ncbi:unnamed protein product [Cylicocyclus nassatus]|uniref:Uncharacterized protein n=1 Tax=Cylicocyclus nassatus TaxID=53992 RepID=A0AA36MDI5_CYLNA|nr:unnamed protein product [Cylicocyclus nassatus]
MGGIGTEISVAHASIVKNLPHRISQVTVFVSVILVITLIMVAAHVVRLIMAMQKMSKAPQVPTAIVIQPKEKHKKAAKQKKKASLACKHRSNYNLPSKLMMVDIEVKKETEEEKKKKKKKEAEGVNPVTNMAISAPPPYKTLKPAEGSAPGQLAVVPTLANESTRTSEMASAKADPGKSGGTVVKTVRTETVTTTVKTEKSSDSAEK